MYKYPIIFFVALLFSGCNFFSDKKPLVYNQPIVNDEGDTIIPGLGNFQLLDQDSMIITPKTVEGKVVVADFFFCSCPSICPKMKKEMLRVYEKYEGNMDVVLLSFSIDPKRDSVGRLHNYAGKLGVKDSNRWHFLTGDKDMIYQTAEKLMIYAAQDSTAPGGYIHNGKFALIDGNGDIRGYYEGTDSESVSQLLTAIDVLLAEKK